MNLRRRGDTIRQYAERVGELEYYKEVKETMDKETAKRILLDNFGNRIPQEKRTDGTRKKYAMAAIGAGGASLLGFLVLRLNDPALLKTLKYALGVDPQIVQPMMIAASLGAASRSPSITSRFSKILRGEDLRKRISREIRQNMREKSKKDIIALALAVKHLRKNSYTPGKLRLYKTLQREIEKYLEDQMYKMR